MKRRLRAFEGQAPIEMLLRQVPDLFALFRLIFIFNSG
jgi:hypothetical protein